MFPTFRQLTRLRRCATAFDLGRQIVPQCSSIWRESRNECGNDSW